MTNGASALAGNEYIGTDIGAGYTWPKNGIRQNNSLTNGYLFGWMGSPGRYVNSIPQLAAWIQVFEETGNAPTTIAAAATSTTANTSILPAGSLIRAVLGRVTFAIPTAGSFQTGSTGFPTRFKTGTLVAAGTTFIGTDQWNTANAAGADPRQNVNAGILITPRNAGDTAAATPATNAGRVAFQVVAEMFAPPTA